MQSRDFGETQRKSRKYLLGEKMYYILALLYLGLITLINSFCQRELKLTSSENKPEETLQTSCVVMVIGVALVALNTFFIAHGFMHFVGV